MEDNELIERYFRGELQRDEVIAFEKRLTTDQAFKELFEIESVVLKSIQYSVEKERIQRLAVATAIQPTASVHWLKSYNLVYAGGAALVVWLISNIVFGILHIDASLIKWIGLAIAFTLSAVAIFRVERQFSFKLVATSAINGLILFVICSGIDSINQGVKFNDKVKEATLIPYTHATVWWPTQSLVDSVTQQKSINRELNKQKDQLNIVLRSVRDSCFESRFDKIVPIILPKHTITASGMDYEADVFAAVSYLLDDAEITIDGKPIEIAKDPKTGMSVGRIKLKAEADNSGLTKRSFEASIKIRGKDYKDQFEYFVAKPVIKVTTGAMPILYMNCGNEVNIEVPALGTSYDPTFKAEGAEVIKGAKTGMVTIIPKQRKISVSVSNGGTKLGDQLFDVKNIPAPRLVAYIGSTPVDLSTGIRAIQQGNLTIKAVPEENFRQLVPNDARYRITKADITLGRGTAAVAALKGANENLDLWAWTSQARPGDRIVIEVKTVVRKTFNDTEEVVTLSGKSTIIIPIW
jgi:hypothetical protein